MHSCGVVMHSTMGLWEVGVYPEQGKGIGLGYPDMVGQLFLSWDGDIGAD